jgi:hypothetical protein
MIAALILAAILIFSPKIAVVNLRAATSSSSSGPPTPLTQVIGQSFQNTTIDIDNHEYINCTFGENLVLEWDGGPYAFVNLRFSLRDGARMEFVTGNTAVKNAIALFTALRMIKTSFR